MLRLGSCLSPAIKISRYTPGCALSNLKGYTLNLKEIVPAPNLTTQSLIQKNPTYRSRGESYFLGLLGLFLFLCLFFIFTTGKNAHFISQAYH